jgi:hypothetical protein
MIKKIYKYALIIQALLLFDSCKKPYAPPAITSGPNHLVVEGIINAGSDSTIFKLSRTVDLSGNKGTPELNASVAVENDQSTGPVYYLNEIGNGKYAFAGLNLDNSRKYRIRIKTNDGREYISDFVTPQFTPIIDSVGFNIKNDGLQIYVNTHDANNNTKYYRWDYEETWQFHAKYVSTYISNGTAVVPRTPAQNIYYCFANNISSDINLGSSAKLIEDNIYQSPITFIPSTSEKIESKYSILVRQYALTKDAFAFWQNLKKNTEQLGSIFDAQPSEISGNIHCLSNASEPVIGYVSACLVRTKRIFISNRQLPTTWAPVYPYACDQDSNYYVHPITGHNDVADLIPLPSAVIITNPFFFNSSPNPAGFFSTSFECADCTIRGTTKQPVFWK